MCLVTSQTKFLGIKYTHSTIPSKLIDVLVQLGSRYTHSTIPARFIDVLVKSGLDFIIGKEGHIARVCHCQEIPVPQDWSPWLKKTILFYLNTLLWIVHSYLYFSIKSVNSILTWLSNKQMKMNESEGRGQVSDICSVQQTRNWVQASGLQLVVFDFVYNWFVVFYRTELHRV